MLWHRSKTSDTVNYFGIYNSPTLFPGTEKQFIEWESLLQSLDSHSLEIFLEKAAGLVTACIDAERGWSQLVECINEVRGYGYALSLGYTKVRLLREQADPLPDIEASNADERCLVEVKTIQKSDLNIEMRGQVQKGESGLPVRLKRLLRRRYSKAIEQITGHTWNSSARKICYMIINVDLRTVLADENRELLHEFLNDLQADVEIHSISQHWRAKPNAD